MREKGALTITELRKVDFELVVAPSSNGQASGSLYVDDGDSLKQKSTTEVKFTFKKSTLTVGGSFGFPTGVKVSRVKFLNVAKAPKTVKLNGRDLKKDAFTYDSSSKVLVATLAIPFTQGFVVQYS